MSAKPLTTAQLRAVNKHGHATALNAYELNCQGEGASTVGIYLGVSTREADVLINAGRILTERTTETK